MYSFSQNLRNMITKLFLIFISVQNNFMITTNKNWEKNHKSTNNATSNDGSSIEIIDLFHGDYAVNMLKFAWKYLWNHIKWTHFSAGFSHLGPLCVATLLLAVVAEVGSWGCCGRCCAPSAGLAARRLLALTPPPPLSKLESEEIAPSKKPNAKLFRILHLLFR